MAKRYNITRQMQDEYALVNQCPAKSPPNKSAAINPLLGNVSTELPRQMAFGEPRDAVASMVQKATAFLSLIQCSLEPTCLADHSEPDPKEDQRKVSACATRAASVIIA